MRLQIRSMVLTGAIALTAAGLPSTAARADAIDGDWCNGASTMHIDGETILTPGRSSIKGRYTRYSFAYVVPANEPGAGSEVNMVMIRGLETVHLTRAGQTGSPEAWRRCKPVS